MDYLQLKRNFQHDTTSDQTTVPKGSFKSTLWKIDWARFNFPPNIL